MKQKFERTASRMRRTRARGPRGQRGAAQLFITIVLLVVIMMLGVTATIMSSTQFKLA